jgi:hypothetical protein
MSRPSFCGAGARRGGRREHQHGRERHRHRQLEANKDLLHTLRRIHLLDDFTAARRARRARVGSPMRAIASGIRLDIALRPVGSVLQRHHHPYTETSSQIPRQQCLPVPLR